MNQDSIDSNPTECACLLCASRPQNRAGRYVRASWLESGLRVNESLVDVSDPEPATPEQQTRDKWLQLTVGLQPFLTKTTIFLNDNAVPSDLIAYGFIDPNGPQHPSFPGGGWIAVAYFDGECDRAAALGTGPYCCETGLLRDVHESLRKIPTDGWLPADSVRPLLKHLGWG